MKTISERPEWDRMTSIVQDGRRLTISSENGHVVTYEDIRDIVMKFEFENKEFRAGELGMGMTVMTMRIVCDVATITQGATDGQ